MQSAPRASTTSAARAGQYCVPAPSCRCWPLVLSVEVRPRARQLAPVPTSASPPCPRHNPSSSRWMGGLPRQAWGTATPPHRTKTESETQVEACPTASIQWADGIQVPREPAPCKARELRRPSCQDDQGRPPDMTPPLQSAWPSLQVAVVKACLRQLLPAEREHAMATRPNALISSFCACRRLPRPHPGDSIHGVCTATKGAHLDNRTRAT